MGSRAASTGQGRRMESSLSRQHPAMETLEPRILLSGAIVSWGHDNYDVVSDTPVGDQFTAVAAGFGSHAHALTPNGSIVSWGYDNYDVVSDTPTASGFVAIAAGDGDAHALTANGSIVSWGYDNYGAVSGARRAAGSWP